MRLLSIDILSMEQTEDKIKHICHWNGSDTVPWPFRIIHSEKQACACDRAQETPFHGYTSDTEEDRNQRIKEKAVATC